MQKISVIVPVYNAEKYLPRCIESIISQRNTEWELLLIDDGSQDNSGALCDDYAGKDSRIRALHKPNGGVSSARNVGLDNMKGEWVAFIDADDYVDQDFLSITNSDADIIEKSYISLKEDGVFLNKKKNIDQCLKNEDFYRYYINHKNNALWDKLFSARILNGTRFDTNLNFGEDFLFFMTVSSHINTYVRSSLGCYYYVQHETSAMGKLKDKPEVKLYYTEVYIRRIIDIASGTASGNFRDFLYGVVNVSTIQAWYRYRSMLSQSQKVLLWEVLSKIPSSLHYVNMITSLKVIIRYFQFGIKKWLE